MKLVLYIIPIMDLINAIKIINSNSRNVLRSLWIKNSFESGFIY